MNLDFKKIRTIIMKNIFLNKMLIYDESGEAIGPEQSQEQQRKTIPKSVKGTVWNKYIGKALGTSKCFCCRSNDISQMAFEAGHVIPECKGGLCTVENLRPICKSCNGSMGSINMNEFMKQYYLIIYSSFMFLCFIF